MAPCFLQRQQLGQKRLQFLLSILFLSRWPLTSAQLCQWSQVVKEKGGPFRYSYNLAAPVGRFAHGALSEDGFYKVVQDGGGDSPPSIVWFQLCEPMRFNSAPPDCDQCSETCGGKEHCGETCSALQRVNVGGYAVCTTMATSTNSTYSFIDPRAPEKGLAVSMPLGDGDGCPDGVTRSLLVNVLCPLDRKHPGFQPPSQVTEDPASSCNFVTTITHPAGCPARKYVGGYFWWQVLGVLLGIIGGLFAVYLAIGIIYRTTVHGASGIDAIPHLDFWRSVHDEASVHVRRAADQAATHVQPVYNNHVHPVLQRLGSSPAKVKRRSAALSQAANIIANETTPLAISTHSPITQGGASTSSAASPTKGGQPLQAADYITRS